MFKSGGIILTLMPERFWRRTLYQQCLYIYQRFFIWQNFRCAKLAKLQKQTFARCEHVQLAVGKAVELAGAYIFLDAVSPAAKFNIYNPVRLANESYQIYAKPLFSLSPAHNVKLKKFADDYVDMPQKWYKKWLKLFCLYCNAGLGVISSKLRGRNLINYRLISREFQFSGEVCTSCLRYVEINQMSQQLRKGLFILQECSDDVIKIFTSRKSSQFFKDYDIEMITPAMFLLFGHWEIPSQLFRVRR